MCEESSSFDLTPYDLASAMDAINVVLEEQAKVVQQNEINAEFNMELANSGVLTTTNPCFAGIIGCHYRELENNFSGKEKFLFLGNLLSVDKLLLISNHCQTNMKRFGQTNVT